MRDPQFIAFPAATVPLLQEIKFTEQVRPPGPKGHCRDLTGQKRAQHTEPLCGVLSALMERGTK